MKTPYCTALKTQRREVDEVRISIGVEIEHLSCVERHEEAVRIQSQRERALAAGDWTLSSSAYFTRARAELRQLAEKRKITEARLDQLRAQAREAYGSLKAVEGAADRFRDTAARAADQAEQAGSDDRSAASVMRALQLARAAGGRRAR